MSRTIRLRWLRRWGLTCHGFRFFCWASKVKDPRLASRTWGTRFISRNLRVVWLESERWDSSPSAAHAQNDELKERYRINSNNLVAAAYEVDYF